MRRLGAILTVIVCMIAIVAVVPLFYMGHLNAKSITMKVGDSAKLEVSNPLMQATARYSSKDGRVAHTEDDGTVTAYGPGTTTVQVKTSFRTLECPVSVLGFLDESTQMLSGQTEEPKVLGASKDAVFHSSDENVLKIVDGKVKALQNGKATLTCEDKGLEVSQTIEVSGIISDTPYLFVGNEMKLDVADQFYVTTSDWSVENTEVAMIDEEGVLTGMSAGTALISCQADGGITLQTSIDIIDVKEKEIYLLSGEDAQVSFSSEKGFNADGMKWESADTQVACVDDDGLISAAGLGSTTVVGKINDQKISEEVHVVDVPTRAFTAVGMSAKILSEDKNSELAWKSKDNSKVKIRDGKLVGISKGTANITASAGDRTFTCQVTVGEVNQSSVTLPDKTQTQTLRLTGTAGQEVDWYSADDSVAKVSDTGEVMPVQDGKTAIVCAVGSSVMSFPVTVGDGKSEDEEERTAPSTSSQAVNQAYAQGYAQAARAYAQTAGLSDLDSIYSTGETNSTVEEPEIRTNGNGILTGPEALIACGDYYTSVLRSCSANGEKWVYSNSSKYVAQTGTFEKMLKGKIRGGNCASIVNWAFQDMGILSGSQKFYGNSNGKIQNYNAGGTSVKSAIDAACNVIKTDGKSFKKLMEEGRIEVGDILIGKSHTYIYRGDGTVFASGHDAKWHKDASVQTDDSKKAVFDDWVRTYKGTYDEKCKVYYIIRLKNSYVPRYYRDTQGNLIENQ